MAYNASERNIPVPVNRIEVEAEVPFETLRRAFEAEVPPLDTEHLRRLLDQGAEWRRIAAETAGGSIHRFVRFWSDSATPVMRVGGADTPSAAYLIGDYATAARMFRHDAGVMLYTPIRVELHGTRGGRTVLSVDQPSTQLSAFGSNKITQAAFELDRMLGDLLEELGLPRPARLRL